MPISLKRLLLVEDEAVIALAETKTLRSEGYEVLHAANGEAAVELVRKDPRSIDLILMDIDLGRGMDGTEAAREILRERDLPVVFLSSHTEPALVDRTEQITNYGYILKSAGTTVLLASIKMAFKLHDATLELLAGRDALRRSEEQFRSLVENIDAGIFVVDLEDRFIYGNPAAHHILRMHGESLEGHRLGEFLDPENARIVAYQTALRKQGIRSEYEFEILTSEGARRKISVVATPRRDENGEVAGTLAIVKDVTDLKAAEDALRRSEARFRLIFDESPLPIAVSTPDEGRIIDVNLAFSRLLGYWREEIIGKTGLELGVWVERADRDELLAALNAGSGVNDSIRRIRSSDGRVLTTRIYASFVKDWEAPAVIFMVEDITEMQNAQLRLKESERSLRRAEQLAGFGNWEFDLQAGHVRASPGAREIYGLTNAEDLISEVQKLPLPEYRAGLDRALADLLAGDRDYDVRFKIRRPVDGRVVDIRSRAVCDRASGNVFGVIQDVTASVLREEELRRNESQYSELVANLNEGICVLDAEDRFVIANPAAHRIFEVADGELVGVALDTFLDEENRRLVARETAARRMGRRSEYGMKLLLKTGRFKPIYLIATPRRDAAGGFLGTFAIVRDLSDVERAQAERRRLEAHYKFIFDNAATSLLEEDQSLVKTRLDELASTGIADFEAYFAANPAAVEDLARGVRILDVNREYQRLVGAETKEGLLSSSLDGQATYNPLRFGGQLVHLYAGNRLYEEEKRLVLPSGEERLAKMQLFIAPGSEADWSRVIVSFVDVTAEKRIQADLTRSLEQKNVLMRELEHRIKNNLNIISSLLSLEEERLADPASKQSLADMQSRIRSVSLIYELLSHGAGTDLLACGPYLGELAALMRETHGLDRLGIELRLEAADLGLDTKRAVSVGLILNELLTNAIKYAYPGPRKGEIRVKLARVGDDVRLCVEDDGVGVAPGFDWRAGSSLGFQLVDMLARQMKGVMETDFSAGLRVAVRFPLAAED